MTLDVSFGILWVCLVTSMFVFEFLVCGLIVLFEIWCLLLCCLWILWLGGLLVF